MDSRFLSICLLLFLTSLSLKLGSCSATSFASLSDGQSLIRAMEAWKSNFSTWVGDDPCGQHWDGVRCNDAQRVVYLNLSNKGVQGPIPDEIGNLEYLEILDLNNPRNATPPLNAVTGDLSALKGLTYLQSLNLSFNNVELSSFPSVVLTLNNLKELRLDNNYLSGALPTELSELTQLEILYLGNNTMTGPLPPAWGNLVNLKELSLWNNDLNSEIPTTFGKLLNLTYLNLHDCNLYGGLPYEFGNFANLLNISLYKNSLTGKIPDSWSSLKKLYNFWVYGNYLTGNFPTWIEEIPTLFNLSLDHNYFYGSLPTFANATVKIVTVSCNFFNGTPPSSQTIQLNYTGNCFYKYDSNDKIACRQYPYVNCDVFQSVAAGNCPECPSGQVLQDSATCVCTIGLGTGSSKKKKLAGSIIGVGGFLIILAFTIFMRARYRKKPIKPSSRYYGRYHETQGPISELWEGPEGVVRYSLEDIERATDGFDNRHEIGVGGFGKVFYAVLGDRHVAIKRAHLSSIQSSSGFRNEILLLSRLHHKNLVRLLGFCEDDGIQILVYEYMPYGNLHMLLFKNQAPLDWLKRLDISIGVAQGLEYLHSFADPPVIHRDVKPSNILLDENLVAKLSDFGISKVAAEFETHVATRPAGTVGYIDPQYILREQLTTASDVYSFGMVLLELISGQKCVDNTRMDERNLAEWVKMKMETHGLMHIVDPQLGNRFPSRVYEDIIQLGIDCTSFRSEDRPSMKAVVTILDACRWSVSPLLDELPSNSQEYPVDDAQTDESFSATEHRSFVKNMEPSVTLGCTNTYSASTLIPR